MNRNPAVATAKGDSMRPYLTKYDLMLRWSYDPEDDDDKRKFANYLWRLRTGRHPSGATLHPLPIREGLYDPADVLAAEGALKKWKMGERT